MNHLVIPLDRDHTHALAELVREVAVAAGVAETADLSSPHVTLIAHTRLPQAAVWAAVEPVAARTAPFTVHAHGYGFFAGDEPSELSLHVPVVRAPALDDLHRRLWAALGRAGAEVAGWSQPELWSPHITLLGHGLDPTRLGDGAAWLARSHHPSWRIPVDRIALTGGWNDRPRSSETLRLGTLSS